jgi:hypothetical protein
MVPFINPWILTIIFTIFFYLLLFITLMKFIKNKNIRNIFIVSILIVFFGIIYKKKMQNS